ncbi:LacI family transcriptional regulator [Frigidibacter sp. ROC022]|uniref:LacI family transcriptional regulator n=1 Tax=Frigidibacter sp. ROC022 TaxID=2971796 RepID=UPI00215AE8E4|nr:LacI family transcriptional regulator [Frigidibacter sp. ROC022]MCR8726433.1 LacI family transcriptional regulator [Frigidibacter sp. ROC022]
MADTPPDPAPKAGVGGKTESVGRPTLKTISQLTGLAVATVSRALHDAPDIGEATKRRVQETADRVGYRPNRAGVRLRTGKTNVISLVLSTDHDVMNHTARLISSIAGGLRSTPYHMIVTPYFPSEDPMVPVRYVVETQSADALILNQIEPRDPRIAWLLERGFPFATHGRSVWGDRHAWFDFDNTRFGEIACEELARRGRRNVLIVAPPMGQNYAQNMVDGATRQCAASGITCRVAEGVTSDDTSAHIQSRMAEELTRDPGIDGVISASTTACMAVVAAVEDSGRKVGADVDLFSKEAVPFLRRFRREILAVHEDVATAGAFLAKAAMERVADPNKPPMQGLETPTFSSES